MPFITVTHPFPQSVVTLKQLKNEGISEKICVSISASCLQALELHGPESLDVIVLTWLLEACNPAACPIQPTSPFHSQHQSLSPFPSALPSPSPMQIPLRRWFALLHILVALVPALPPSYSPFASPPSYPPVASPCACPSTSTSTVMVNVAVFHHLLSLVLYL